MGLYRILIVDDEPESIQPVQAALHKMGYDTFTASDGWDGISKARQEHPDLVLLDVKMPQMDGWTFMKFVRSNRNLASLPVIFLTGQGSPEDQKKGYRLGADGYLVKPVDLTQLASQVSAVLDRRSRGAERRPETSASNGKAGFRMRGRLDQLGLTSLFSILGAGRRTGTLEVFCAIGGGMARVVLHEGRVVSATAGTDVSGLDAVESMGRWVDGEFSFVAGDLPANLDPMDAVPCV
jgi:CheY-like chemotaxis protein